MMPQRSTLCRFAAKSILVVMAGLYAGLNLPTVSAQSAKEFSVYCLNETAPTEARRLLSELLGDEAKNTRIVADDATSELLVSGSPIVQKLATKLVEQLNSSQYTKPATERASVTTSAEDWESSPITNAASATNEQPNSSEWPAKENSRKKTAPKIDRGSALRDRTVRFRFRNITSQQAEHAVVRLLGARILELQDHELSFSSGRNREVTLSFDETSRTCLLEGSEDLVEQFAKLLQQLDNVRDHETDNTIRFVPLANVEPDVLNKAVSIWKQTSQGSGKASGHLEKKQGRTSVERVIRPASFQQIPGEPAILIETDPQPNRDSAAEATTQEPAEDAALRRPSSDVTVEPLPDLDVLILRGRDPDVEELTRIIREIERLSAETAPEIDVVYLHNVRGEALEELITDVLDDLTGPLQGRVSITPLVKPNALLLIGWGEAVTAAKKLIARLDESVEPLTQMQIYALKHASANQVESTVREFLNDRGGLGPEVNITADERTNSLIVNAAPRDLTEVTRLIENLDKGTSESVNHARIVQLRNSLADDVSQTIMAAITAARGGVGTQRSAALEMLMVGPDGNSVVASGLLQDVKLTPDARTNRIFITGPAGSLSLVEQLIKSLDESPAASAQIKVFQITNGDATDLVQVLRSLFPEQAGVSTVPQLATAEEESSLVPVRFSVDIRTNSIIATGTSGDLKIIEALLLRLDETDSQERVNEVYRLKNSPALDVANAVNNFLRSERVVNQAAPGRQNPFTQIESEVVVVPEPVGNALIISATPRYFEQIMELVEGLDAQPPQVMIQVILVEVELDNLHEFGVELGLQDSLLFDRSLLGSILTPGYNFNNQPLGNANTPGSLATRGTLGGQALSHFSLGRTSTDTDFGGLVLSASSENVSVLLRAMNQSRNVEILSRPQIMTLDNQPAFIQVGQRVPRIVGTSINQVGQVNTVELENVGLILGVTPRISPEGMVVMEIDAEKSEVGPEIDGIPVSISSTGEVIRSPRVNITTAQTTVSSASGQTIVIGGLITTNNTTLSRRIPWLSDVPVLGNLFRFDGTKDSRKELLIILTPHVVRGPSEAEYIKQVETARMSWISCDTFNWMNTDTAMVGQMDSPTIPTIYPDRTPGAASMQQAGPLTPSPSPFINPDGAAGSSNMPGPADTKVVIPEWKIETGDSEESEPSEESQIKQMSFRSTSLKDADKEKLANTAERKTEIQPLTKSKSYSRPKSEKKSFWTRD